jgi:alpha-galactosidase
MSLWAISGAPLIVGTDLTKLTRITRGILTNPEVIAVDQDSLGVQAVKVAEPQPNVQVWARPLATRGAHAVLLLNRTSSEPARITVSWAAIGLDPATPATVRDLWTARDLGSFSSAFTATVPSGDAVFVVICGTDARPTRYEATSPSNEFGSGGRAQLCKNCASTHNVAFGGEKSLTFKIAPVRKSAFVQIDYLNRANRPLTGRIQMDSQVPINILFPPTGGSSEVGVITVEIEPSQMTSPSLLRFSSPYFGGLSLESISVLGSQ